MPAHIHPCHVYPCLPLPTHVHTSPPISHHVHPCARVCTHVHVHVHAHVHAHVHVHLVSLPFHYQLTAYQQAAGIGRFVYLSVASELANGPIKCAALDLG